MCLKFLFVALAPCIFGATVPKAYLFPNSTASHQFQTNGTTNTTIQVHGTTNATLQTNGTMNSTPQTNETANSTLRYHQQEQPQQVNTTIFRRETITAEMRAETDILLFDYPLEKFNVFRKNKWPPELIWKSNACSHAPDKPFGLPFKDCCQRHDFGYRNYLHQRRWNLDAKEKIDKRFLWDMHIKCANFGKTKKGFCRVVAASYYYAVSVFGWADT